jgi:hypothetical protein
VVWDTVSLTRALTNTAVGRIVLDPGTYILSAELSVTRSVVLQAVVAGSVVLNAQASSSSPRRVLNINPGSSGVVQLIRLAITGGFININVCAHVQKFPSPDGRLTGDSRFAFCFFCLQVGGGGVYVGGGTVTISSCTISGNQALHNVRAHVQKFPSPPWEKC